MKKVRCDLWAKHRRRDLTTVVIHYGRKEGNEQGVVKKGKKGPGESPEDVAEGCCRVHEDNGAGDLKSPPWLPFFGS